MSTTYGSDRPIVGPVLDIGYDAVQGSTTSVAPSGGALAMASGTVTIVIVVKPTGSSLTPSVGSVVAGVVILPSGTQVNLSAGGVTVTAGATTTVGVSGAAITMDMSSVALTVALEMTGQQMDVVSGTLLASGVAMPVTENVVTVGPARRQRTTFMAILEEQLGQPRRR